MILFDLQVACHRAVDPLLQRVGFPRREILFHLQKTHPVQGHNIEFPDRPVVLRGIARCHDHVSVRHSVVSEGLVLQELEHGGCQRLGHTVDLIQEKDPLADA